MLLKKFDLIIAIGCDPIEYEARNWNAEIYTNIATDANPLMDLSLLLFTSSQNVNLIGNVEAT